MAPPRLTRAFGTGTGQFSSPVTQGIGYWDTGTYLQSVRVGTDALDDLLLARNFTSFGSTEPIQIFETQVSGGLLQLASMPTDNAFGTNFVTDITGGRRRGAAAAAILRHHSRLHAAAALNWRCASHPPRSHSGSGGWASVCSTAS
jgi:hypothetical protein